MREKQLSSGNELWDPAYCHFRLAQAGNVGRPTRYNEGMMRKLEAVYERGVLRPVVPLRLDEYQHVNLIILDDMAGESEALQFVPREEFEALADHGVTLKAVREALAKIPGSLDADFLAERN